MSAALQTQVGDEYRWIDGAHGQAVARTDL
jgi:hypothetical protein